MKKYLINGKFLSQRITGVQRFAIEIIKELDEIIEEGKIILLVSSKLTTQLKLKKIKVISLNQDSSSVVWTQIIVPFMAIKEKAIPLTLSGLYPLFYPGVATIHDITPMKHRESYKRIFYLSHDFIYRISIKRLKHIFTVSEFSKKEISDYYHVPLKKISVVYNASGFSINKAVSTDILFRNGIDKNRYILSVGSLHSHKNPQFMFELSQKYTDMKFVVVGGTTDEIFETIEKKNNRNLIYIGYISDDELIELYRNAIGFVLPSLYEGFGIPALEAIQLGIKHIAVSDIPVFRELYGEGVYFFNPYDIREFDMSTFLDMEINAEQRNKYMSKYSWSSSTRRMINEL